MITQTFIGSWYKFLYEKEPEETELFFQKLCTGIGLNNVKDPINVLRNIFVDNLTSDKRLTRSAKHSYIITTWNSHLLGRTYTNIPFRYGRDKIPVLFRTKKEALASVGKQKKIEEKNPVE